MSPNSEQLACSGPTHAINLSPDHLRALSKGRCEEPLFRKELRTNSSHLWSTRPVLAAALGTYRCYFIDAEATEVLEAFVILLFEERAQKLWLPTPRVLSGSIGTRILSR